MQTTDNSKGNVNLASGFCIARCFGKLSQPVNHRNNGAVGEDNVAIVRADGLVSVTKPHSR